MQINSHMDNMLISLPIHVTDEGRYIEATISVGPESLTAWCLGLCLLESKRLGVLVVRAAEAESPPRSFRTEIRRAEDIETGGRAQLSAGGLIVQMASIGIANWLDASVSCLQDGRPVREALPGIAAVRSGQLREVTLYLNVSGQVNAGRSPRRRRR